MKIISSDEIQSLNDKKAIEEKKHTKEIFKAVNPPKQRPRRTPAPRRERTVQASRLKDLLQFQSPQSSNVVPSAPKQYKEWTNSMKETAIKTVVSIQPEYSDTIRDKLTSSNDIVSILSDKIMNLDLVENEWLILALTIGGKFLEANTGI